MGRRRDGTGLSQFIGRILSVFLVIGLFSAFSPVVHAEATRATYYVSPTGKDTNPGTKTLPWKTIQRAVDATSAGDTVYVRAGTYHEDIYIGNSGTASARITIAAYTGERPIIDGQYTLPQGDVGYRDPNSDRYGVWEALVLITGNYVTFSGFEVSQSLGRGIVVYQGGNNQVNGVWVHNSRGANILIQESQQDVVQNSRVWQGADFAPYGRDGSVAYWPGALSLQNAQNITIRGNTVYNNWGEGILPISSSHVLIEGNTVYDNFAVNIYADHSSYITIQRNLVYSTNTEPFLRDGNPPPCIGFADEVETEDSTYGTNYTVVNNLVKGCFEGFFFWGGDPSSGLRNSLIAYNTFVEAISNPGMQEAAAISIGGGAHSNTKIINNIILQSTHMNVDVALNPELHFSRNLWSRTPTAAVGSSTDVIANPKLALSGSVAAGALSAAYFKPGTSSPAIGKAEAQSAVKVDYYNVTRGSSPTIGAIEVTKTVRRAQMGLPTIQVSLPTIQQSTGTIIQVPVNVADVEDLSSADVTITYDPAVVRVKDGLLGDLTGDWSLATDTETPGQVHVSLAHPDSPVSGSGVISTIEFEFITSSEAESLLHIEYASLNNGELNVETTDGLIKQYGASGRNQIYLPLASTSPNGQ